MKDDWDAHCGPKHIHTDLGCETKEAHIGCWYHDSTNTPRPSALRATAKAVSLACLTNASLPSAVHSCITPFQRDWQPTIEAIRNSVMGCYASDYKDELSKGNTNTYAVSCRLITELPVKTYLKHSKTRYAACTTWWLGNK